ncbi:hypothetical protein [uncultured Novosphingobium sp.]|uniref:spike base protein, RCAP_Rcc01079 family n=1 Tax=uncultured Novosphingobium sp. TaxID=292277 RepID=UPI0037489B4E
MSNPYTSAARFGVRKSAAITPHATNPLPQVADSIYIGVTGDVTCRLEGDSSDRLFKNCMQGTELMVRATHVRVSGTTATNLVAMIR